MAKNEEHRMSLEVAPMPGEETPPDFVVTGFEGEEEISSLYRFELDLESENPGLDVLSLLHREATFTMEHRELRKVRGIVQEAAQLGKCPSGRYAYRIVLGPTMAKLDLSRQSQIYGTNGEVNVLDIAETELTAGSAEGTRGAAAAHIDPSTLDIRAPRKEYPLRNYVVQYKETDLAFVRRLLEHRGIFFFFDHSDDREKLILGDHNASFDPVPDPSGDDKPRKMEFSARAKDVDAGNTTVQTLVRRCSPLPAKLMLREHNYRGELGSKRNPEYLHVERTVSSDGHGVHVTYDEQFKDTAEGRQLAKVRAEGMRCRQDMYTGTSDCYLFSEGHVFELQHHFNKAFNQPYLIVSVKHKGGIRLPEGGPAYSNEFTAIPASTPFRPERRTPRPLVPGVFNAYVDASGDGLRAAIDDSGRYKIRLPFDLTGADQGMASRYMRMAQPYANFSSSGGGSGGMHFPLLKGTEVLCACVNGNPDRPVILSAIPNPRTKSPVTGENAGQNRIRTTSGIL
ncbi:MAG: type VI secretion system tip protein TssI/VgrG, partial [Pseudomonadota bacterium]